MRSRAPVLLRGLGVAIAAALSLVVTVQVAASMNVGDLAPETILRIVPGDARSLARQAEALAQKGNDQESLDSARAFATRALSKEPTQIIAVRAAALAWAQRGDVARAGRIFAYAEGLTRRDLITHIWFIEANAAENDIAGALQHYDLALRTSRAAGTQLLGVLTHATSDPKIARQLAAMLAARPPWAAGFYSTLIGLDVPPETVGSFIQLLRARSVAVPPEILDRAIANLVAANQPDLAWKLYASTAQAGSPPLVRNGSFGRVDRPVPFEWQYSQDNAITVSREADGKAFALVFRAEGGATGDIARQLLTLRPGRYQLVAAVTSDEPSRMRLEWQVTCARQPAPLAKLPASAAASTFEVPAEDCAEQWLALKLVETTDVAAGGRVANVGLRAQPTS